MEGAYLAIQLLVMSALLIPYFGSHGPNFIDPSSDKIGEFHKLYIGSIREQNMGLLGGDGENAGFDEADKLGAAEKKRVIDEEAGVVIYAVSPQSSGYGVTAVPIEDTDLETE